VTLPPTHTPRWHRYRAQLAAGETTPLRIAALMGLPLIEALAWLYPTNPDIKRRVKRARRNEVTQ
jgi:hypothetical protein